MDPLSAVVLNEGKLNFDDKLKFDALASEAAITIHKETSTEEVILASP